MATARRVTESEHYLRAGRWTKWSYDMFAGAEVHGSTLGILGMGRIGVAVARRGHFGFGMPVVFYDPVDFEPDHGIRDARRVGTIEEVLEVADFVSLHMPGGSDNTHLIDAAALARMKPSAFLVNSARGDVIDQEALIEALRSGTIAGAGLDVYEAEPDVPAKLIELDNAVLLPHLGSATLETRTAMGMLVLDNLQDFLDGREPSCRVA